MKEKGSPEMGNIEGKIGCTQCGKSVALHNAIGVKSGEANVIASDEARSG